MPKKKLVEAPFLEGSTDIDEDEWDDLCAILTEEMDKLSKGAPYPGNWHCTVSNFGWRNLNGHKDFVADNGHKLLQEVLPNTDCHFRIYIDKAEKCIRINNAHHDSPTWKEWYVIIPTPVEDEYVE